MFNNLITISLLINCKFNLLQFIKRSDIGPTSKIVGTFLGCYFIWILLCFVIFVPIFFAAIIVYLLYIDIVTKDSWFLSFAFPVVGGICLIITAVVTLTRYLKRGKLYIFGGAVLALAAFMPTVELLMSISFEKINFIGWSFYPLMALAVLGGLLIFIAIYRPARELMEQKFFIQDNRKNTISTSRKVRKTIL